MAEPWPRDRFRAAVLSSACSLSTPQRLVAIALSEYATRWERAQVSHAGLIAATGLSQSSIARALNALKAAGWIAIEVEPGGGRQTGRFRMLQQAETPHADDSESLHSDESPVTESRHADVESRQRDAESLQADDQSQEPSQSFSHDAGARDVADLVDAVGRASSLPRERETEAAADWLVRELLFTPDDARSVVAKYAAGKEHPLAYLQGWHRKDPNSLDRKRPSRPKDTTRYAKVLCSHGRPVAHGAGADDICCEIGERERAATPRVHQRAQGREVAS